MRLILRNFFLAALFCGPLAWLPRKQFASIFRQNKAIPFDPDKSLGSSLDILPAKQFEKVFSPEIIKESLSAGWGPITYRQNTELTIGSVALESERNVERYCEQERILHRKRGADGDAAHCRMDIRCRTGATRGTVARHTDIRG